MPESRIDQRIGNYRIVRKLGEGGMGTVLEAVDESIGRRVAIKVLFPELSLNPEIAARFHNEARAVNIVRHPGLVGIFAIDRLPDGAFYIVMEYLEGESLGARFHRRGGRLEPAEAMRLCRQIAAALSAAHQKGIVHRDLKPDNVMVVPDPEAPGGERAKVLDFGIAKVTGGGAGQVKTRTRMLMGTPMYMAPEQCRGAGGVDDKADVYSLGVMLYQFLSGQPPFNAEGVGEILVLQISAPVPPLREAMPWLPEGLCALVHAMLAKEPRERPAMTQVVRDLEALGAPGARSPDGEGKGLTIPLASGPTHPSTLRGASGQRHAQAGTPGKWGRALVLLGGPLAIVAALSLLLMHRLLPHQEEFRAETSVAPGELLAVSGDRTHDLWAVGEGGTVLRHLDGGWSARPMATTKRLSGVWADGTGGGWAVGATGTLIHLDPSGSEKPMEGPTQSDLHAVGGSGSADVWAVGMGGTVIHYDGHRWSPSSSGTENALHGVLATGPREAWAVGEGGTVLHFNHEHWSQASVPASGSLEGVWANGPADVWTVGESGTILHYDGYVWSRAGVPDGAKNSHLYGVWGSGPVDIWAVGDFGTVLHFDGRDWSVVRNEPAERLLGVSGKEGAAGQVWVVGSRLGSKDQGFVLRKSR